MRYWILSACVMLAGCGANNTSKADFEIFEKTYYDAYVSALEKSHVCIAVRTSFLHLFPLASVEARIKKDTSVLKSYVEQSVQAIGAGGYPAFLGADKNIVMIDCWVGYKSNNVMLRFVCPDTIQQYNLIKFCKTNEFGFWKRNTYCLFYNKNPVSIKVNEGTLTEALISIKKSRPHTIIVSNAQLGQKQADYKVQDDVY
ncbi:MAG: hypothetical protein ACRC78_10315 [Planktothrix sp.]